MSPLVSIVIPTFDRPAYLPEAVASALAQTYPKIEVLIGDNGAGDASRKWNPDLAGDPRVLYRCNPRTSRDGRRQRRENQDSARTRDI